MPKKVLPPPNLPSETRQNKPLQATETPEGIPTHTEGGESPPEWLELAHNASYPFVPVEELQRTSDWDLPDINRIRKIEMYDENLEKYRYIVRKYPEQRLYKDKYDYVNEKEAKTTTTTKKKGGGKTFYER